MTQMEDIRGFDAAIGLDEVDEVLERAGFAAPQDAGCGATPAARPRDDVKAFLKKLLLVGAGVAVLAAGGYLGREYWTVGRFQVSTDDAYVKADNTTIAPKVSGYVAAVLVGDNERVKAGQALARIDDRDYKVARRAGEGGGRGGAGRHRQQAGGARRPAIGHRSRAGDGRRRPREPDLRRTGEQALLRPRDDGLWQRAERAAGARSSIAGRARRGAAATRRRSPTRPSRPTC